MRRAWCVNHQINGLNNKYPYMLRKQNCAACRDVNGPKDCHTDWTKSEREEQTSYINTCKWNLEKWYRWTDVSAEQKQRHRCRQQTYGY